jgi:hypothetical protein
MSVAAGRKRDFFGTVSGALLIGPADTGLIPLVPAAAFPSRIRIQKIHVEVTAPAGAELWTFQDGAGIPIVPNVSAGAIAHFDFNFGPDGVPCSVGTAFVLNISGATGARGWITWEAYRSVQVVPSNYSAMVLADQPVGYWRLGESSGTVAADSSGRGRTGTYINGPTLGVPGVADGTAVSFSAAATQRVDVADDATLRPPAFSLEVWFYQMTTAALYAVLAAKQTGATWTDGYGIYSYNGGSQVYFFVNHYTAGRVGRVGDITNAWHHIVGTFDGTTVRCYLDAVAVGVPVTVPYVASTQPFRIGAEDSLTPAYYWDGRVDEVAIYATVLSPERIAQHYREGLAR